MKILTILFMLVWPGISNAADASFVKVGGGNSNTMVVADEAGLTYDRNYYLNVDAYDGKKLSFVVTYSSVTYSNVTFSTNAYSTGSGQIAITGHGLTLGTPVIARVTSGNIPPVLTAETTYYAAPITENIVAISSTLAKAQTGDYVLFTSSKPGVGTQTYTLVIASPSINGYPSFTFAASNDGTNFYSLGVSSTVSDTPTYSNIVWGYNFDDFNYAVLRMAVDAPMAGGVDIKGYINIKR